MTSNKRIHELLEWIKYRREFIKNLEPVSFKLRMIETEDSKYEILQHLLEMDIENNNSRQYCKEHNVDFRWINDPRVYTTNNFGSITSQGYDCEECYKIKLKEYLDRFKPKKSQEDKKENVKKD